MAIFIFIYCVIAGRVERMPVSGPIIFVGFGLAFGPLGLGLLTFEITGESLRILAELTLAIVLFTDAAGSNLGVLRRSEQIPVRLLLIGLPLTILLGFVVGWAILPGLTLIELTILATMLAPTDAALGSAVVSNPKVPSDIREGLNVESGLNDGICVPILFVLLALATDKSGATSGFHMAMRLVFEEIGIGLVVGLSLSALGWWFAKRYSNRGWINEAWRQVAGLALALVMGILLPLYNLVSELSSSVGSGGGM